MGQSLSSCLSYMSMLYIKLIDKTKLVLFPKRRDNNKDYYSNEIVLKEEERPAGNDS